MQYLFNPHQRYVLFVIKYTVSLTPTQAQAHIHGWLMPFVLYIHDMYVFIHKCVQEKCLMAVIHSFTLKAQQRACAQWMHDLTTKELTFANLLANVIGGLSVFWPCQALWFSFSEFSWLFPPFSVLVIGSLAQSSLPWAGCLKRADEDEVE